MSYHRLVSPVLFGAMFSLGLVVLVSSCGRRNSDAQETSENGSGPPPKAVQPVSSKPMASTPQTPENGPQTYEEYTAELGKVAQKNQSYGRRIAMAGETLSARERVLAQDNATVQAAQANVAAIRQQLAAVEKALAEAEKTLSDAYEADPEWVAAKARMDEISKEADASRAKTMALIAEAHKKGIHLTPQSLKSPESQTPAKP